MPPAPFFAGTGAATAAAGGGVLGAVVAPNGLKSSGSSSGKVTARAAVAANAPAPPETGATWGTSDLRASAGVFQPEVSDFETGGSDAAGGAGLAASADKKSNAGNAPPMIVRFGSAGFGSGGAEFGIRFGLSKAAMTRAMFSGRSAGSGCSIQVSSGTRLASTPVRSGTDDRLPTASTIDAPICSTSPRLAPAVTKASEYISDRPSTTPPNAPSCSGATQLNLPANWPCNNVPAPIAVDLAMPKSISLACSTMPSSKITLSGDRSR